MVQINFQQLRDYLSVFEPGFPIQKGYVAQLLFQHSIPDVFRKVKAIVTAAEPNKNLHEGSLRSRLNLFKKFIISRKNWLIKEWPTRIELLLEPFLITFRCHHLPSALKSTPSAATSSEDPEQTSTQIPVEWMQFPQSPDTQIHSDLTQTPDTQIHSDLTQSPDTQIHSDLPQSPDTQIHSDLTQIPVEWMQFPQSPDTQMHSELPQTPDTLIQSDNLQTSTPVQTAPPNISQSCSATCSSQSPMTLKKSCASCVAKQRTNMNMLQDNKRLHHQLKDLKTLFRAEKGNFSLKRFNEIIKRKTESMTMWKNRYATLKVSNNTQQLLESVYSLEQKVKTLEEKLIATQEESLNMTSVIEQLKSMHEKTENYDAHLKHVSSYSPSPNIYTHTAVEENRTIVHNSHSSVCVREGVLSARASKDHIITTKNMVEDVCYRQDVRSEEESNEHTHKEAAESVIIIDYQVMMAGVKNNHNNQCSEDLHQGRNNKLLEQGLSAGQKTPQQNVADIVVSSMNSLDKTLTSQKTPQQNVADIVISSPNSLDKTLASQKIPQQNAADIVISSPNSLEKTLASQKSCQPSVVNLGKRHTIGNKCGSFGRTFKENSFQKHRLTHTEDKLYKCDVCGRKFAQDSLLKIHKRAHKGHKPYKCDVCGRGFSVKVYLKIHTRTHTGEKPYKCDVCGRGFSWSGNRDVHKQSHVIERPYECDACGLCFTQQCSLEIHTRTHVSRTPFKCKVCGLEFEEKADMRTHKLVHKGEKNIVCDICGKRFRRQCDLTLHNRKHTGEKPYQCNVCGRGFAYSNVLKSHERIHSEERPYQCDVCGFAFRQSSSLNTHKLIHTGVKPYACDICGFQVNRKDNLRLHKKVHKT